MPSYEIRTAVTLDEWSVEGLRWAYKELGYTTDKYTIEEVLNSVAHDAMHSIGEESKRILLNAVAHLVESRQAPPLTNEELYHANCLEEFWALANLVSREEFLRRIGGWSKTGQCLWALSLRRPTSAGVIP